MDRTFTVESSDVHVTGGRYVSAVPSAAAKKAGRQLFASAPNKATIKFMLRETTVGSAKKEYSYIAKKEKLDQPKVVRLGTSDIKYTHSYNVKACKMPTA